jgi:hypothetical protein
MGDEFTRGSGSASLQRRQFQSSPARGGGCNAPTPQFGKPHPTSVQPDRRLSIRFQSSPARGGGHRPQRAYPTAAGATARSTPSQSSILTRPWGRVQRRAYELPKRQHYPHPRPPARGLSTQSSPARGGGCNSCRTRRADATDVPLQSSPARWGRVQPRRTLGAIRRLFLPAEAAATLRPPLTSHATHPQSSPAVAGRKPINSRRTRSTPSASTRAAPQAATSSPAR